MDASAQNLSDLYMVRFVTPLLFNLALAVVILVVGLIVAGWTRGAVYKAVKKSPRMDELLAKFLASLARYLVIAVTVLAILDQFGVETASLIALLGTVGLAVGLALQGTLSNVAAGVMLLVFRPFKVGDYVEAAGHAGTVQGVTLFVTELSTPDNVQIILPNGQVWGSAVMNYSFHDTRRVDILLGISYEDDIAKAMAAVQDTVAGDDRAHKDPAPVIAVAELADSSVNLTVRVWCDAADYWPLKFDLTKALKERMDREGIAIPYPQHTVHMAPEAA